MVRRSKAHVILVCEAGSLKPYMRHILRSLVGHYAWMMLKIFLSLAWLGQEGSIQHIAGPRGHDPSNDYSGPKRRGSYAIFETKWGHVIWRKEFAASCTAFFSSQDLETMTRARMATTRTCGYHVNSEDAGKSHALLGECLAAMLVECCVHQVTSIGGANKMAHQRQGQQLNFSYCMWLSILAWQNWADNGYTHEECSRTCFARCECENLPDCAFEVFEGTAWWEGWCGRGHQKKTMNICDCSTLTFCEFGNFRVQRGECRNFPDSCVFEKSENISSIEKTHESLLYLTNEVLLLRDGDTASHCPLMVWLEPADLFNQEKKSFQSDAGRKEGRSRQAEGRSEGEEAKGKAEARSRGITFIRKDSFIDCCVLPIRIDYNFHWRHLTWSSLRSELCWKWNELTM